MSTLKTLLPTHSPAQPAIFVPSASSNAVSHGQFAQHCLSLQQKLADLGIGPKTAVSISLPNSHEFVAVFLAICFQRAIAAPLNPSYKEGEVAFYLDDLDAAAIVVPKGSCESGSPAVVAARKKKAGIVECYVEDGEVQFDVKEKGGLGDSTDVEKEPEEDDVALVLHTSGTTGKPKAVSKTILVRTTIVDEVLGSPDPQEPMRIR